MKRPRLRRMKAYHPRKRTKRMGESLKGEALYKQSLHDLKHKISSKLGRYIILLEEGNKTLVQQAHMQAKGNLLKYSGEMKEIAHQLGERVTKVVEEYLASIDQIVHVPVPYVDASKIKQCYAAEEKLEKELNIIAA